ncbi:MAG TPA: multicopper oxidase domain-containing protein [Steroidobacteraceae bacterium]|nr:multicopper oxidase domain-containing protein [Steroidobacteraceae bacterium]
MSTPTNIIRYSSGTVPAGSVPADAVPAHTVQARCARSGRAAAALPTLGVVLLLGALAAPAAGAQPVPPPLCPRPVPGGEVADPVELQSRHGVLQLDLTIRNENGPRGPRYCYVLPDGAQSPTLRVHPGDLLILRLHNALQNLAPTANAPPPAADPSICRVRPRPVDACSTGAMSATATNLHFHGMTVPPLCHQDDVLHTFIPSGGPPFEYRFRIPTNEAPGLYWYHPHVHGFSKIEVLGGASGALIVEGIARANPLLAGLPERVFVIRDQQLLNPDAPPSRFEPVVPRQLLDRDGDAANNGTGFGKPAMDLSVNFIPVPYPDYPPARIRMRPGERQLWRVLNAGAITYLNLAVLFGRTPRPLGIVAMDGVPLHFGGSPGPAIQWVDHIGLPPGARAEFVLDGPPAGVPALLVTRAVDTGPGGENDPNRALAAIVADADAPEPRARLDPHPQPLPAPTQPWIGDVAPVRVRRLYFSEQLKDPNNPNGPMEFFITVEGQKPAPFDPNSTVPNITVRQGDVEDWIIENRSNELHAFHIHQLHFQLRDWSGIPVNEPFLRDTVNVPYYSGRTLTYPSVRLRMDFRDPNTVGIFVYHCHLLEHEDGGMMGTIRVLPATAPPQAPATPGATSPPGDSAPP